MPKIKIKDEKLSVSRAKIMKNSFED